MSLCLSYTLILGNIQTEILRFVGGSLFAAAICIFTLEQGKESGGKRNPVYYGCLHHSKRMGVFSRWFFGIFISFYYDDVFAASSGICDGEICSCFIYNEPYDVSA